MRRWSVILLLLLVFLISSGGFLLWRVPRLLEVSPARGARRVSAEETLRLRFSRRMQTASVDAHLQIDPAMEGELAWEGNTLSFTPDTPWPSGITVTVRLEAGAYAAGFPALPTTGGTSWSFAISRPMLAYLWPANLPSDIYALDPVSGEILRLTEAANVQDFSVSADGTILYYSAITQAGKADIFQLSWRDAAGTVSGGTDHRFGGTEHRSVGVRKEPLTATRLLACPDAN
jgi:hypothetical protein